MSVDVFGNEIEEAPETKAKKGGAPLWDYVNDLTYGKKNIIRNSDNPEEAESGYVPWLVNKALSYGVDTILMANEMNLHHSLDNLMQYEYLINNIRSKRRRFEKWYKKDEDEDFGNLELVKQAYKFNNLKAELALSVLTKDQLRILRELQG